MENLVEVEYAPTGKSANTDELGMREMRATVLRSAPSTAFDRQGSTYFGQEVYLDVCRARQTSPIRACRY